MTVFDFIVIGVVLLSGLIAFSMGFVRVVLALAGWVGAVFATLYGFRYVRPIAQEWISVSVLADAAAGLSIFLVTLIVLTVISHAIGRQIRNSLLSALDRSLGLVFGLLIGLVIVSLGFIAAGTAMDFASDADKQPEWIRDARSRPLVEWSAERLRILAPAEFGGDGSSDRFLDDTSKRQYEQLIEPETRKPADTERDGYSEQERREMDRLFRGQR